MGFWKELMDSTSSANKLVKGLSLGLIAIVIMGVPYLILTKASFRLGPFEFNGGPVIEKDSANVFVASTKEIPALRSGGNPYWSMNKDSSFTFMAGLYNSGKTDATQLVDSSIIVYSKNDSMIVNVSQGSNFNGSGIIPKESYLFTYGTIGKDVLHYKWLFVVYTVHYSDKYHKRGFFRQVYNASVVGDKISTPEATSIAYDSIVVLLKERGLW
jgi:hypothetical protein